MRGHNGKVWKRWSAVASGAAALIGGGCNRQADPPVVVALPDAFTAPAPRPGKPLPPAPPAADGRVALERMVTAYKKLDSLQQTSDADIVVNFGPDPRVRQETVVKYQLQPARVALIVRDPVGGTQQYVGDGSTVVWYMGLMNQFIRRSAGPTMDAMVRVIDRDAPQAMSPLVFLTSNGQPTGVATSRLVGPGTVNGKAAVVVEGTFRDEYLRRVASAEFAAPIQPAFGSFTLWLEPNTYLLLKSSVHMGWRGVTTLRGSAARSENPRVDYTETVRELVQNPTFGPDDFRFVRPHNAKEIFIERREADQ